MSKQGILNRIAKYREAENHDMADAEQKVFDELHGKEEKTTKSKKTED